MADSKSPHAQSDDNYERITFLRLSDHAQMNGTVGWREGSECRVALSVWNGPNCSYMSNNLRQAFKEAQKEMATHGFVPLVIGVSDKAVHEPEDLFAPLDAGSLLLDEMESNNETPFVEPILWMLALLILLAVFFPVISNAAQPELGVNISFPNAPYAWRYEGPDFDTRNSSEQSAVRKRFFARQSGKPVKGLDPVITILAKNQRKLLARYELSGSSFCDYEDDNCSIDGIFPVVLSNDVHDPILAVVTHVGAHSQRLTILRPLKNASKPVFEVTASYALTISLYPDGMVVHLDEGSDQLEKSVKWPENFQAVCNFPVPPALTFPAALSDDQSQFVDNLSDITNARNFSALMEILTDDVLVSFGGDGGKKEFVTNLDLKSKAGKKRFWQMMEKLMSLGVWGESIEDGEDQLTWPWFFAAWPEDQEAYGAFIAAPGTILFAGPNVKAPQLSQLPFSVVNFYPLQIETGPFDETLQGWLSVRSNEHCLGYVRRDEVVSLLDRRLIARKKDNVWKIEAFVAGD